MSQFSVYFDEDAMDTQLIEALGRRGVTVVKPAETALGKQDEKQLLYALWEGVRALYIQRRGLLRDPHALVNRRTESRRYNPCASAAITVGEQLRRLLRLRSVQSAEARRNRVEFLSNWG